MIEKNGKENELALFWLPKNCDPENITVTWETLESADENKGRGAQLERWQQWHIQGTDGGRGGWAGESGCLLLVRLRSQKG